jgi:homoserine kinase
VQRIRLTVPATLTNIGPSLGGLALAVQLHASLEFRQRNDDQFTIESSGVDADAFDSLNHPAALAAMRVFQQMERAPAGFQIRVSNNIPVHSGLGVESAFAVAGVLGANNIIDARLSRPELLRLAAQVVGRGDGVAASMLGGLATGVLQQDKFAYLSLASVQMKIIIVVPQIKSFDRKAQQALPKTVKYDDAVYNLSRVPLLVDAFQRLDMDTIGMLIEDRVATPHLAKQIKGYDEANTAAKQAGASAVTISGHGPALVAFASDKHHAIAEAMRAAFEAAGVKAQSWVVPVEQQGVSVSMTQSVQ